MNKYAFISSCLTLMLSLLEYIPLGIVFGMSGSFSNWMFTYFGFTNPLMSSHSVLTLELMNYADYHIFIWGLIKNGIMISWVEIHPLSFIFFFIISILAIIASFIASFNATKLGKRMSNLNLFFISIVLVYFFIGIPIYSQEIIEIQFSYFNILYYLDFGFYLLILDLILSIFSYVKHPMK